MLYYLHTVCVLPEHVYVATHAQEGLVWLSTGLYCGLSLLQSSQSVLCHAVSVPAGAADLQCNTQHQQPSHAVTCCHMQAAPPLLPLQSLQRLSRAGPCAGFGVEGLVLGVLRSSNGRHMRSHAVMSGCTASAPAAEPSAPEPRWGARWGPARCRRATGPRRPAGTAQVPCT